MKPGSGAFALPVEGPPQQAAPAAQPQQAQDPAAFLEQLGQLGLLQKPPRPEQQRLSVPPTPQRQPAAPDPLAQLAQMTQAPAMQAPPPAMPTARPTKKPGFVAGKPGQPRSGMSVHEMLRDPSMVEHIQGLVSRWESENPGRKLMGSHLQALMPELSPAQARTLRRRFTKLEEAEQAQERVNAAAYKAMRS